MSGLLLLLCSCVPPPQRPGAVRGALRGVREGDSGRKPSWILDQRPKCICKIGANRWLL